MTAAWKPSRLVVTGAAGWLGRRLVDALLHGLPDGDELGPAPDELQVRCLVQEPREAAELEGLGAAVEVVVGDVRDPASLAPLVRGCEGAVLFHAAAVIHPRRRRDFMDVNAVGTGHVLDAAIAAGVARAVVVSSNSPFGFNPERDHRFDESSPYRPYMGYGRSKMRMEQLVAEVAATGRIETVVVRAPWFYGPYQPPRQTLFFEMIRDGRAPIVGDGDNRRSMVYVDNLCQGLALAARVPVAAGRAYWIADERPYRMNEIVDTVERLLEQEFDIPCAHRRLRLPDAAAGLARLADGLIQGLGFYQQKVHVLSEMNKTIACSIDRARAELGYRPRVSLEEGMRRSIRWCIEQGLLGARSRAAGRG